MGDRIPNKHRLLIKRGGFRCGTERALRARPVATELRMFKVCEKPRVVAARTHVVHVSVFLQSSPRNRHLQVINFGCSIAGGGPSLLDPQAVGGTPPMAKSAAAPADAAPAGGATPPPPPPAGSKITVPPVGSYVVAKTTLKQEVEGFLYTCVVCSRDRSRSSITHAGRTHACVAGSQPPFLLQLRWPLIC